jgi:hypothetical protein
MLINLWHSWHDVRETNLRNMSHECQWHVVTQVNRLDCFYPPNSPQLQQLFATVDRVDFKAMAARYNMPLELATEMVTLAL